jgi:alanine-synthesizing transaminase
MKSASRWKMPQEVDELGQHSVEEKHRSKVREYVKAGKDVISFFASNPPREGFHNKTLNGALIEAARSDTEGYPQMTTLFSDLREAISRFEEKLRNIKCSHENILLGPGAAGCFNSFHYANLEEGDEVLTFDPEHYIAGPSSYIYTFGSKLVTCRTIEDENWQPDYEDLRAKITSKTKVIVMCNPNNPVGYVWNEKTLKRIVDIAGEYKIPILADEMYGLITYDGIKAKSIVNVADDVPAITLTGMSKFFMRPGWRIGYMGFHDPEGVIKEMIETTKKVAVTYGHPALCIPTPIAFAAVKAYQDYKGAFNAGKEMVRETQKHRDFAWKRLKEIDGITCTKPEGSLYAFPKISDIGKKWKTDVEFQLELLKEEGVTWTTGRRYGIFGYGHMRVLLQPKLERLEEAFNRLERFMTRHT